MIFYCTEIVLEDQLLHWIQESHLFHRLLLQQLQFQQRLYLLKRILSLYFDILPVIF